MAFNPFHAFRRHQKTVFAGLTIVCMLTFVAASGVSGGGDVFNELVRFFGGRGRGGSEVAMLYGKRIDQLEFRLLREQRRLANEFMRVAVSVAHQHILQDIDSPLLKLDEGASQVVKRVVQESRTVRLYLSLGYAQMVQNYLRMLPQNIMMLRRVQEDLSRQGKVLEAQKIGQLGDALEQESALLQNRDDLYPDSALYFGGSLSSEGMLDFLIWRHEADRLGIQLTAEDINKEVERETLGRLGPNDYALIEQQVGLRRRSASSPLVTALGDEYRVRLARAAVEGYEPGRTLSQVPVPVTPQELWQFYRKSRTEVNVQVLPVAVADFLPRVKEKPTEEELRTLYDQHKDLEYAPYQETPGFKLPHRIKLQWIAAAPDAAYYRKALHDWFLSLTATTASNPVLAMALSSPIFTEYQNLRQYGRQLEIAAWTEPDFALSFYDYARFQQPQGAASVVGQTAGLVATGGLPLALAAGQQGLAVAGEAGALAGVVRLEAQNRAPLGATFLLADPAMPPVATALTLCGLWQQASQIKSHLPLEVARTQVFRTVEQNTARDLVRADLERFKKDLDTKRLRREEAVRFVKDEVARHGWRHGATRELHSLFDIQDDPEVRPLRDAFQRSFGIQDDPRGKQFAQHLLSEADAAQGAIYTPGRELADESTTYLSWRTEDEPAKVIPFEEARPRVEAAWRFGKARELARAEAERIAKEAQGTKGDALRTLTEAAKQLGKSLFALDGVARLKRVPTPSAGFDTRYTTYRVPEDKVEYPSGDFVDDLLALKDPGAVSVLHDLPRAHYYVAALTQRQEPTVKDFHRDTTPSLFQEAFLLGLLEQERSRAYREAVLKELRLKAHLETNPEVMRSVEERGNLRQE
jgi:hypothetical protein